MLIGGSPLRILRLTAAGARALDALAGGAPVGEAPTSQWLARRLLDTGFAHPRPPAASFTVSVVIPVRDRPEGLAATLGAPLGAHGVGRVVVVDDGSVGAETSQVASSAGAIVIRHQDRHGPGAARNTGARATDSEIVAFVDADCVPGAGWLDALLPHFSDERVGAVAPRVVAGGEAGGKSGGEAGEKWGGKAGEKRGRMSGGEAGREAGGKTGAPEWLLEYERLRSPLDRGPVESPVRPRGRVPFVPAAALLVRRAALDDVGGFEEDVFVGEDVDFVWRLVSAGWTVRYEPAVTVVHPARQDAAAWLRQRYGYGTSAAPLAAHHDGAVAPLTVSAWSALAWGLAAVRRPVAGAAVGLGTTVLLARRLRSLEHPMAEAFALGGTGNLAAGRLCADAVRRTWWPIALVAGLLWRRPRPGLFAAFVIPPLVDWARERPSIGAAQWLLARLADDMAYGAGVWAGAIRARSAAALKPDLSNWPGRRAAVET